MAPGEDNSGQEERKTQKGPPTSTDADALGDGKGTLGEPKASSCAASLRRRQSNGGAMKRPRTDLIWLLKADPGPQMRKRGNQVGDKREGRRGKGGGMRIMKQ